MEVDAVEFKLTLTHINHPTELLSRDEVVKLHEQLDDHVEDCIANQLTSGNGRTLFFGNTRRFENHLLIYLFHVETRQPRIG